MKIDNLIGKRFGRLEVLRRGENHIQPSGQKKTTWVCRCDCGNEITIAASHLKAGKTKSCGCYRSENTKKMKNKFNSYDLTSYDYGIGYTLKGEEFYFDLEDYDKIKDFCWSVDSRGYLQANCKNISDNNFPICMHRTVTDRNNISDGSVVDHINCNKLDNRKSNLRICKNTDNIKNYKVGKNSSTGIRGVRWVKNVGKWGAFVTLNGKNMNFGYYVRIEDAIKAREEAEQKYFGEFSYVYSQNIKTNQS